MAQALGNPQRMLPIIAAAFAELGYRRATTAQLARRCGVRENVLYRAWPSKKAMFLAAIDYLWESSRQAWEELLAAAPAEDPATAARQVLAYESTHHGELGLHRVVFAGLSETDDEQIAAALRQMYQRFHQFIAERVAAARHGSHAAGKRHGKTEHDVSDQTAEAALVAWALIGIGTLANIGRELKLISGQERAALYTRVGDLLVRERSAA